MSRKAVEEPLPQRRKRKEAALPRKRKIEAPLPRKKYVELPFPVRKRKPVEKSNRNNVKVRKAKNEVKREYKRTRNVNKQQRIVNRRSVVIRKKTKKGDTLYKPRTKRKKEKKKKVRFSRNIVRSSIKKWLSSSYVMCLLERAYHNHQMVNLEPSAEKMDDDHNQYSSCDDDFYKQFENLQYDENSAWTPNQAYMNDPRTRLDRRRMSRPPHLPMNTQNMVNQPSYNNNNYYNRYPHHGILKNNHPNRQNQGNQREQDNVQTLLWRSIIGKPLKQEVLFGL